MWVPSLRFLNSDRDGNNIIMRYLSIEKKLFLLLLLHNFRRFTARMRARVSDLHERIITIIIIANISRPYHYTPVRADKSKPSRAEPSSAINAVPQQDSRRVFYYYYYSLYDKRTSARFGVDSLARIAPLAFGFVFFILLFSIWHRCNFHRTNYIISPAWLLLHPCWFQTYVRAHLWIKMTTSWVYYFVDGKKTQRRQLCSGQQYYCFR